MNCSFDLEIPSVQAHAPVVLLPQTIRNSNWGEEGCASEISPETALR